MTSGVIDATAGSRKARRMGDDGFDGFWGSYAMATLAEVEVGAAILEYLARIDATLRPYGGRFLVHGGTADQVEGEPFGDVVVIGFPSPTGAAHWYRSADYQAILALRTRHSRGRVVLLDGADAAHTSDDVIALLSRSPAPSTAACRAPRGCSTAPRRAGPSPAPRSARRPTR